MIRRLSSAGLNSVAAPLPHTLLTDDMARLKRIVEGVSRSIILLGHALCEDRDGRTRPEKVEALVHVIGFAPDEGETVMDVFYRTGPYPKPPIRNVLCTEATSETEGFMKVSVRTEDDRILGFTIVGSEAREVVAVIWTATLAELPYTKPHDAVITYLTVAEGWSPPFGSMPLRFL
jgi:hypothetical protein